VDPYGEVGGIGVPGATSSTAQTRLMLESKLNRFRRRGWK
jgi:hypothetical protein